MLNNGITMETENGDYPVYIVQNRGLAQSLFKIKQKYDYRQLTVYLIQGSDLVHIPLLQNKINSLVPVYSKIELHFYEIL